MGIVERLLMAFILPWRVIFSGELAQKLKAAEQQSLPPHTEASPPSGEGMRTASEVEEMKSAALEDGLKKGRAAGEKKGVEQGALTLMSMLQREGRLIDFLMEDVTSFSDADVGAAARAVHEGCKKVCLQNFGVKPLRDEPEESTVTVDKGYDNQSIRLVGNVTGDAPYKGLLVHGGWKADKITLPQKSEGADAKILAPAEVEL